MCPHFGVTLTATPQPAMNPPRWHVLVRQERGMDSTLEAFGPVPEDIIPTLVPTLIANLKRSRAAGHMDDVADTVAELERILRQPVPEPVSL